jgi:hypothetical protein
MGCPVPTVRRKIHPSRLNALSDLQFAVLALGGVELRPGDADLWRAEYGARLPHLLRRYVERHPDPEQLERRCRSRNGGALPGWWPR